MTTRVDDAVRRLVNDPDLSERLLQPGTGRDDIGVTLVEIDHIDGLRLPVRAPYEQHPRHETDHDPTSPPAGDYGIGVNPLHYDGTLWYALPDVLAATLLSDTVPRIKQAIRLHAEGVQGSLRPVLLRGGDQLDPGDATNRFVRMIELRHRIRRDPSIDGVEKARLDQFLKITANAAAYGSLALFDRREHANPVRVTVYGPGDKAFETATKNPEIPGPYTFPPVAASITAGARLILAMMEQRITDAGGSYAFMDTDSVAIIATPTGGRLDLPTAPRQDLHALSHEQVRSLLRDFAPLDPYSDDVQNDDPALRRSPWKVEHDSLNQPLICHVIASKRYVLYRHTDHGRALVAAVERHEEAGQDDTSLTGSSGELPMEDWSEHGLGMYLDPIDPEAPARDEQGRRVWMRQAWDWILTRASNEELPALPDWAERPALNRFTMSGPRQASWFRDRDQHPSTR